MIEWVKVGGTDSNEDIVEFEKDSGMVVINEPDSNCKAGYNSCVVLPDETGFLCSLAFIKLMVAPLSWLGVLNGWNEGGNCRFG